MGLKSHTYKGMHTQGNPYIYISVKGNEFTYKGMHTQGNEYMYVPVQGNEFTYEESMRIQGISYTRESIYPRTRDCIHKGIHNTHIQGSTYTRESIQGNAHTKEYIQGKSAIGTEFSHGFCNLV
jgi:hypothetical protein